MLQLLWTQEPGPLRKAVEPLLLAMACCLAGLALADMGYPVLEGWLREGAGFPGYLDEYWLREPGLVTPWIIALIFGLLCALAYSSGLAGRLPLRIGAVAFGLLCVTAAIILMVRRPDLKDRVSNGALHTVKAAIPWLVVGSLAAGAFAAAWLGLKIAVTQKQSWWRRSATVGIVTLWALILGAATLADAYEEYRSQKLPPFELRLVTVRAVSTSKASLLADAAHTAPRAARGAQMTTIHHRGTTYEVLTWPPSWVLTQRDVKRVRWRTYRSYRGRQTGVSIRLAGKHHARLQRRSRMMSSHRWSDAIYVDGALITMAGYESALYDGRFALFDGDRPDKTGRKPEQAARKLFLELTR